MTLRNKFRKIVLHLFTCPFAHTHDIIWKCYQEELRHIKPDDLPPKLRPKFLEITAIFDEKIETVVERVSQYPAVRSTPDQLREQIKTQSGWEPLSCMSNKCGKKIKENLFEIYEGLPKR